MRPVNKTTLKKGFTKNSHVETKKDKETLKNYSSFSEKILH